MKWYVPTGVQTLLTTGLDSLTNGSFATSSAYDNSTALDLVADFQLAVCYGTAPSAGVKVAELYLLPSVDGTNYAAQDGSGVPQKGLFVGAFESRAPSTSVVEYLVLPGVSVPPGLWKLALKNTSGQTYKDNGVSKSLKMRPYQTQ
jgi:hypothetical protein